jgi:LacI family transcriptional regulator
MMRKKPSVTIHEIARRAGVGVGTVSRVLNESAQVSPATREQVLQVIAQVGYRPQSAAKMLRTRKSHAIGLITDEIASTPYAVDIIRGAQDAAWAQGKILLAINTNKNANVLVTAIEAMLDRQVEGIIYAAMYHQAVTLPTSIHAISTVLLDCYVEDRNLPSVVPDEVTGGRVATETLLQKGHRRIGFINDFNPIPASFGRLAGYQAALAAYNLPFDPDLVCEYPSDASGGYQGVYVLMQRANPPSALFCFNDRMAMGAYDALRELGLRIPHDVAVIGFDNQEMLAAHLRPPLTTMQLPHYAMGEWAVNYLLGATDPSVQANPPQVQLDCPLILRASV